MAKDDIVIGLGRPMYGSSVHASRKKAYPSVITTLGHMEPEARRWIAVHNFLCRSYLDSDTMKKIYITAMCSEVGSFLLMVLPLSLFMTCIFLSSLSQRTKCTRRRTRWQTSRRIARSTFGSR